MELIKDDERAWRCRSCGTLLGIERSDHLHVKYKRVQLAIQGKVMAVCPRCGELNHRELPITSPPSR